CRGMSCAPRARRASPRSVYSRKSRRVSGATQTEAGKNPGFLPAIHEVMSAEIDADNFSQMKESTQWLASRLADLLPGFPEVRLLVAFSGGVDSTALLAALAARPPKALRLRAVHINHGLHANAAQWSDHCRALARELEVPLEVITVKVSSSGGVSVEAAA